MHVYTCTHIHKLCTYFIITQMFRQMMIAKDNSYCKMREERMTIIYNNVFKFYSFFLLLSHFSSAGSCTSTAGDSVMRNMIIQKCINFMSCGFCKSTYYSEQIKSLLFYLSPSSIPNDSLVLWHWINPIHNLSIRI